MLPWGKSPVILTFYMYVMMILVFKLIYEISIYKLTDIERILVLL